jgi:hypothetical protein
MIGAALAYGAAWCGFGWLVGSWNFARLLRPR